MLRVEKKTPCLDVLLQEEQHSIISIAHIANSTLNARVPFPEVIVSASVCTIDMEIRQQSVEL